MINIKNFVFNAFQENTFVLYDDTKECVIVDAGCSSENENLQLKNFINEKGLIPKLLINTHCHIDHILGNSFVANEYNINSLAHPDDLFLIERSQEMALGFGLNLNKPPVPNNIPDKEISFGNSKLKIMHVPGHSPGSIALYSEDDKFVLVGDVLFNGGIGRTDLPGSDYDTLINSIKGKLFSLDNDFVVYSGHGPSTTIEKEKRENPFL
ncbi:MAG: MBL fold metallo-hydrolase [Bacteroidota bacterium]|nr:MBL fold metallo-hydrolase [Bacteroidota bacterium]